MDPIIIEYVRLCPDCQKRKPTNHHTTTYSTPCAPFEVWQVDLVRSLPICYCIVSLLAKGIEIKYLLNISTAVRA
jgi:hypothetical protein